MITRAQAEALLTLAESLEACERLGITLESSIGEYVGLCAGWQQLESLDHVTSMSIRLAVNALIPKQET